MKFKYNWGWGIAIVYTLFAGATLTFVFFALTQEVDLVRDDYYEYSLTHDQRMSARAEAKELGEQASIEHGSDMVHVHIPREHVPNVIGEVVLYRASVTDADQNLDLDVDDSGTMIISTSDLATGPWRVTATWKVDETIYELEKTIQVD